jgi:hypothetical protein
MLIGIMRQSRDDDAALEPSYECKVLLIGVGLVRTVERLTLETLLNQLLAFKEECDENEQNLVSICYRLIYISMMNFILAI